MCSLTIFSSIWNGKQNPQEERRLKLKDRTDERKEMVGVSS